MDNKLLLLALTIPTIPYFVMKHYREQVYNSFLVICVVHDDFNIYRVWSSV